MTRFTPGELEVMQVLWEHGELKPADIIKSFPREIKNPALRSVLAVLVEKGHLRRRQVGKAYFYQTLTPRDSALRERLRDLADQFFQGSMRTLLFNLVESETLSDADVAELQRLAKSKPSSTKSPSKSLRKQSPTKRARK